MKIVIIGSGNVATVFGRKLMLAGHEILQVISRHEAHAKLLADTLNCGYTSLWENINSDADMYLAAISDNSIISLGKNIYLNHKLIVQTAGSVPKDVLKEVSKNYGVMWPLQSLRKEMKEVPEMPLLVDGNSEDVLTLICDIAKTISDNVHVADDEMRLKLHTAAVLVNNFTNHLYALTEDYCIKENVDFSLLLPIIDETAKRLHTSAAAEMQTGPAFRNDETTIGSHLALLNNYPSLR